MAQVTLQDIFQASFPDYERSHPLPWHVRRAAYAIMHCRTAVLGGYVQSCPDGHVSRIWYNSCKHRCCPQCGFLQIERWLATQQARLLDCDHYHVIFTLPHELNPLWLDNVAQMSSLLFTAVRDTLWELLGDPKYLGARPGLIAALHTWGQTLVLHPHVHCLVTGGGLSPSGQWLGVRNGYLLPAGVVMAVFRGKLLAALRRAFQGGSLMLPLGPRPQPFVNLLNRLGHKQKTRWNVRIMERYAHGRGVATYLARYLRGGALKTSRLVAFDGHQVVFRYHDHGDRLAEGKGKRKRMSLPVSDFMQRVLLPIPAPRTQVVRFYGLYHHTQSAGLSRCRAALGQGPVEEPEEMGWQEYCAQRGEAHPERWPRCGQRLVFTGIIARSGSPPGHRRGERAA